MAFEELGPTFVKLGQLLAARPDLIPEEFISEFKKLHDNVKPIPFEAIEADLEFSFGKLDSVFKKIDPHPIGSASIAQVHMAELMNGDQVVVKVRRPGVAQIIEDDLSVLHNLAILINKYVTELQVFNFEAVVHEFAKSLELETNFIVEANNILKFKKNLSHHSQIVIPHVYLEHSNDRVLVMEYIKGQKLSHSESLDKNEQQNIAKLGVQVFFEMVFKHGLFHSDLHSGNIFILPDNKIGLVDFGSVGRISDRIKDAMANLFLTLANEDYERLAYEYVDLAPYSEETDVHQLATDLQDLISPYFGLSYKNIQTGKILMDSAKLAARHNISVPSELMVLFKSLVTVEGLGRSIVKDFEIMEFAIDMSKEIIRTKYDPNRLVKDLTYVGRDTTSLLMNSPRQLKQLFKRWTSRRHSFKVQIAEIIDVKRSIETSFNILFLGIIIGSLILGSSIALSYESYPMIIGLPFISFLGYTMASILSLLAFYNYFKH